MRGERPALAREVLVELAGDGVVALGRLAEWQLTRRQRDAEDAALVGDDEEIAERGLLLPPGHETNEI